jgi:hypothetical protein
MTVSVRGAAMRASLVGLVALVGLDSGGALQAQLRSPQGYIAGTVRSSAGPEAGVWVIAETKDLPTNFIKIVVTDDAGKFVLPELPAATYRVFVRGYGLVDSTPVQLKPGAADVQLTATLAPRRPRKSIRPTTGCRCSSRRRRVSSRVRVPMATASAGRC